MTAKPKSKSKPANAKRNNKKNKSFKTKTDDFTRSPEYWEAYDDIKAELSRENEVKKLDRQLGQHHVVDNGNGKNKSKSNGNGKGKEEDNLKERYIQKYSTDNILLESVIIGQRPLLAMSQKVGDNIQVNLVDSFKDELYKYLPLSDSMARQYTFKTDEDFYEYREQAKKENLDSLYRKVKYVWSKYIDADNFHISICAADTIFTYFQDKIGLTHYLFFVGGNDTGKTNNIRIIEYVGYRNFCSMGITPANIYTFLGNGEEGQGTICEDEADNIDHQHDKMRIYKSGYTAGIKVARTDLPQGVRSQNKWNTYCFKAFTAERLPDIVRAKGFNQRIVELQCNDGLPLYDIAEVITTAGEEEFTYLLDELNATHNLLLAYRLLHFHDKISNIKLNISNREKQLFKPVLRLFQNTNTFADLLPVISEFVSRRREKSVNTLEAILYDTLVELIKKRKELQLESSLIWNELKGSLSGQEIPNKPMSYESEVFGTISQKGITETLIQVFGAKKPKHKGSSNKLIFDKDRLTRLSRKYAIKINVEVTTGKSDINGTDYSEIIVGIGEDGEVGEDVGLDKHLSKDTSHKEIVETRIEIKDNLHKPTVNNQITRSQYDDNTPAYTPQTSPTSPNDLSEEEKAAARTKYEELSRAARKESENATKKIKEMSG